MRRPEHESQGENNLLYSESLFTWNNKQYTRLEEYSNEECKVKDTVLPETGTETDWKVKKIRFGNVVERYVKYGARTVPPS